MYCESFEFTVHCRAASVGTAAVGQRRWDSGGGAKVDYGQNDLAHNEMGYVIGTQPCIFGPEFDNPTPPVIKTTTKLMSIQHQNNTHPRYGDMGVWEIRAAYST